MQEYEKDTATKENEIDFESQFNKKETIEFQGMTVQFIDISPTQKNTDVPIFIVHGWGVKDHATFKDVLRFFYEKKRRVFFLDYLSQNKKIVGKSYKEKSSLLSNITPLIELRKAEAILAVVEHKNISQFDTVFYSEGGINGVIAAIIHPEKFRNIILVDPGGLIGKDSVLKLTWRFITEIIQWTKEAVYKPKERVELMQIEKEILAHVTQNPFISIKEANAIANGDSTEMLRALHHQSIGIAIIHSINDKVFPINKIQNIVDEGMVDYFYPVKGSHAELMVEPQKYVNLIIHAIDEVEQRKRA